MVASALIDMYARFSCLKEAEKVFSNLPNLDSVCWDALLAAYVQHGHAFGALQVFDMIQNTGIEADRVIFVCIESMQYCWMS